MLDVVEDSRQTPVVCGHSVVIFGQTYCGRKKPDITAYGGKYYDQDRCDYALVGGASACSDYQQCPAES